MAVNRVCSVAVVCVASAFVGGACCGEPGKPAFSFEVISDRSVNAGQLREVWVRIEKPVPESAVREIAQQVKAADRKRHPKTSVMFLLPAMEVNKGAWARAVFRPKLEVRILGASVPEHEALAAQKDPPGDSVGTWLRVLPGGSTHTVTISKSDDGTLTATYSYPDGASWAEEVVQIDRGRKYRKAKAQFGEFQVINDEGDLELWDEQGRIETLKKVDR
jgi:hypothetical protein